MIAFHFRAAADIGTGHARRCAALAHALAEANSGIMLIADPATIAFARPFMPDSCRFIEVDGSTESILNPVRCERLSCLVLDRYDLSQDVESMLAPHVGTVAIIDDFAGRSHACDILIDQNIGRRVADWTKALPAEALLLTGSAFALLRPEFAGIRSRKNHDVAARSQAGRVFVCFGGADPLGLTDWLMPAMTQLVWAGYEIVIVVGDDTKHLDRIEAFSKESRAVALHIAPNDVAALMTEASIAIGAPGSMTLERACAGLPQVLVSFADNQIEVGELAEAMGVARYLGDWQAVQPEDAGAVALDLLTAPAAAATMSARARQLVDGRGARRVAATLLPETDRNGGAVRLRPMRESDSDIVFQWQNSEGMRRFSNNPGKIAQVDHDAWVENRLANAPLETYIAYNSAQKPLGLLHLKQHEKKGWWVSLLVAPETQGNGTGRAMLRQVGRIYCDEPLFAEIRPENTASIQAFESTGFIDAGDAFVRTPATEFMN
ncbi:MAG: UDP-2,4-diacetamido-2,4,6-trideoxy-beta-L-altropyranose hydrolase [Alphaproteobacteria bacterium]|nr:UDP-2,4-diacetamido-2,4,6-trideoxy-beta-L-altropyranose hydrolase [Alphaproteobacteria bacterium]